MNLNTSNPVTSTGDYDLGNLHPGSEYLLTMKGTWGSGASLTLKFPNGPSGAYHAVDGGTWDGSGETEARFIAPAKTMRLTLAGATSNLKITVIPIA
jgi:hypothetical protein